MSDFDIGGLADLPEDLRLLFARQRERHVQSSSGDQILEVRVIAPGDPERHVLRTDLYGELLSRLQKHLDWSVWSMESGPSVDAPKVPTSVRQAAQTEVVAERRGSFSVVLRKAQLEISSSFDNSVGLLLDMASFGDDSILGDELVSVVRSMGPRASQYATRFFQTVADAELDLSFDWREGQRREFIDHSNSALLVHWLKNFDVYEEQIDIDGTIVMMDANGRFRITDDREASYEGKALVDLGGWSLGARCRATILVEVKTAVSGGVKPQYKLVAIAQA